MNCEVAPMARRVSSMGDLDTASLFLSLPDGIFISSVRATTTELVVRIACQRSCAACPLCQQTSERVHGNYGRTVADLPCAGRRVILALTVRKFVCSAPTCPRQIFTELLPDRKEETLTAWLLTHPEIEVISRDRGGEYAAAARKGAPQAQQIADKFHLVKNLRDGLKELMAGKQKVLPEVEEVSSDSIPLRAQGKRPASALEASPKPDEPEKQWRSMSQEPRHIAASSEHSSVAPSG